MCVCAYMYACVWMTGGNQLCAYICVSVYMCVDVISCVRLAIGNRPFLSTWDLETRPKLYGVCVVNAFTHLPTLGWDIFRLVLLCYFFQPLLNLFVSTFEVEWHGGPHQ